MKVAWPLSAARSARIDALRPGRAASCVRVTEFLRVGDKGNYAGNFRVICVRAFAHG